MLNYFNLRYYTRMRCVKHFHRTTVKLENNAFFGVDTDAIAANPATIVEHIYPVAEVYAELLPSINYFLFGLAGNSEPVVQLC